MCAYTLHICELMSRLHFNARNLKIVKLVLHAMLVEHNVSFVAVLKRTLLHLRVP